jgi:hypothetical protein
MKGRQATAFTKCRPILVSSPGDIPGRQNDIFGFSGFSVGHLRLLCDRNAGSNERLFEPT